MQDELGGRLMVVAGDVTMDWNLARLNPVRRGLTAWDSTDSAEISWQRGGAALLADLLGAVGAILMREERISMSVRQPAAPTTCADIIPGDPRFHHSFAIWAEKKYSDRPPLDKEKAWRVDEFVGLRRADSVYPPIKVVDDSTRADIILLDDADLGFRDAPDCWPLAVQQPANQSAWFVVKMARPVAQGPLWEHLHRQLADRLIVVTTANELRSSEVQISRELSWERTAQDLYWELVYNPCVNALSHCAHGIVSFGAAGVVLLSRYSEGALRCHLFFDPCFVEGAWESGYPGAVMGYTTCLTAGIVRELMLNPVDPDIASGIQSGLAAMRVLHADGYGERGRPLTETPLHFPIGRIAACLGQAKQQFDVVEVQDPLRFIKQPAERGGKPLTAGFWTILEDRFHGRLDRIAEQIVRDGPENSLRGVPIGQFGNLLTVDRQEIESLRSIRALMEEYCSQGQQKRPLSIAVFGAPGSGKSFGITEVANTLLPGRIEVREFNLSQLTATSDLISALHQVRDIGLSGKIPLIFWDEFDTTFNGARLGWLRYFLAPMQDGRFQEGQISHPIGRSIFVFAGGTAPSMAAFGQGLTVDEFRAVKGPDFVSRLKGFVNILGPNRVPKTGDTPAPDPYYIIRRAILLRSLLKRSLPELFEDDKLNIDSGVLRAMLQIHEYRHGVRSMESIIMMSQLAGKKSFERSCLPSEAQLDLHVNGLEFLSLVQQIELTGQVLEDLAAAAHEVYRAGLQDRGGQTSASGVAYNELPEELKEQNRQNVRDIPIKLAGAGYAMVPARSNDPPFSFPGEALERLAEIEHERWAEGKFASGWTYADKADQDEKESCALLPWGDLSEEEKDKDRDLVRGIPRILARAGYAIVKARP